MPKYPTVDARDAEAKARELIQFCAPLTMPGTGIVRAFDIQSRSHHGKSYRVCNFDGPMVASKWGAFACNCPWGRGYARGTRNACAHVRAARITLRLAQIASAEGMGRARDLAAQMAAGDLGQAGQDPLLSPALEKDRETGKWRLAPTAVKRETKLTDEARAFAGNDGLTTRRRGPMREEI